MKNIPNFGLPHQSPLLKGGVVAEHNKNLQNYAECDDGGFQEVHSRFLPRNKNLKLPARELRKKATKQENHLWYDFLNKLPMRFLRQYVVNNCILDFYCHEAALAIEVDGAQHYEPEAAEHDKARTEYLNGLGIKVIRFSNRDVDNNFAGVFENIKLTVEERCKNPPSRGLT